MGLFVERGVRVPPGRNKGTLGREQRGVRVGPAEYEGIARVLAPAALMRHLLLRECCAVEYVEADDRAKGELLGLLAGV